MKITLTFIFLFFLSQNLIAAETKNEKIYNCIFENSKTKKIAIANKMITLQGGGVPMPYSSSSEAKCRVLKNRVQTNGLLMQDSSAKFLETIIRRIALSYSKACKQEKCKLQLDCKLYATVMTVVFDQFADRNKSLYGIMAEASEPLKRIIDDKVCLGKINGILANQKARFYRHDSCVNMLDSDGDKYTESLLEAIEKKKKSNQNLYNCLKSITDI